MHIDSLFDSDACVRCHGSRLEASNFCAACKLSCQKALSEWLTPEAYVALKPETRAIAIPKCRYCEREMSAKELLRHYNECEARPQKAKRKKVEELSR